MERSPKTVAAIQAAIDSARALGLRAVVERLEAIAETSQAAAATNRDET